MILTDTGPIVGLCNRNDTFHQRCVELAEKLPSEVMVTTWACFTEAMYLLGQIGGNPGQELLWHLLIGGDIELIDLSQAETLRMQELMKKYSDLPMDLADASLVALAEFRGWRRVFTLDSDFRVYRLADGATLDILT